MGTTNPDNHDAADGVRMKAWALVAAMALAGCFGGQVDDEAPLTPAADEPGPHHPKPTSTPPPEKPALAPEPAPSQPIDPPRYTRSVVVADIGAGTNPYHVAHQRPGWTHHPSTLLPGIPADLPALDLTFTGDIAADLEADATTWAEYQTGQVYWIPETNLIVMTQDSYVPHIGGADGYNVEFHHGLMTADAIGRQCPDCYVFVIQDWGNIDGSAMASLAADYPWVDLATSTSFGFGNDEYVDGLANQGYAAATRAIHDAGGLAFAPTGNGIVTPNGQATGPSYSLHFVNMPPWVVQVGGSESLCRGIPPEASKPAEFVADYTQWLAIQGGSDAEAYGSGTSFSTPAAAGVFGQTLWTLRQMHAGNRTADALWLGDSQPGPWLEDGRLTNEELRAIMASSATHFATTEYKLPPDCPLNPPQRYPLAAGPAPASPTPWLDMGWGHLGPEEAERAAQVMLQGDVIQRGTATIEWMDAWMDVREGLYPW